MVWRECRDGLVRREFDREGRNALVLPKECRSIPRQQSGGAFKGLVKLHQQLKLQLHLATNRHLCRFTCVGLSKGSQQV
jgi:hypothetical protein